MRLKAAHVWVCSLCRIFFGRGFRSIPPSAEGGQARGPGPRQRVSDPLDSLSPPAGGAGAVLYAAGLLAAFADWLAGLELKGGKRRDMV